MLIRMYKSVEAAKGRITKDGNGEARNEESKKKSPSASKKVAGRKGSNAYELRNVRLGR